MRRKLAKPGSKHDALLDERSVCQLGIASLSPSRPGVEKTVEEVKWRKCLQTHAGLRRFTFKVYMSVGSLVRAGWGRVYVLVGFLYVLAGVVYVFWLG